MVQRLPKGRKTKKPKYGPDRSAQAIRGLGERVRGNVGAYASMARSGANIARVKTTLAMRKRAPVDPIVDEHIRKRGKIK